MATKSKADARTRYDAVTQTLRVKALDGTIIGGLAKLIEPDLGGASHLISLFVNAQGSVSLAAAWVGHLDMRAYDSVLTSEILGWTWLCRVC